mmetsp:Transcript_40638/g.117349  ORF Transcript_40638/g.117349 Transcript_40638/m.117349 type:complete len:213 (+) Transcript_40638:513-1151(+)
MGFCCMLLGCIMPCCIMCCCCCCCCRMCGCRMLGRMPGCRMLWCIMLCGIFCCIGPCCIGPCCMRFCWKGFDCIVLGLAPLFGPMPPDCMSPCCIMPECSIDCRDSDCVPPCCIPPGGQAFSCPADFGLGCIIGGGPWSAWPCIGPPGGASLGAGMNLDCAAPREAAPRSTSMPPWGLKSGPACPFPGCRLAGERLRSIDIATCQPHGLWAS